MPLSSNARTASTRRPGWSGPRSLAICASGRIALALFLDALDRRPDASEMRVDGERRLEGLERRLVAAEREIDLAEAGERAEMMRLELQRVLDVTDAGIEITEQIIDGRTLVPALGEIGAA